MLRCLQCGGEVSSNGKGFKCRYCGATYTSPEELTPKMTPAHGFAPQAANQSAAGTTKTTVLPQAAAPVVAEMEPEDIYERTERVLWRS